MKDALETRFEASVEEGSLTDRDSKALWTLCRSEREFRTKLKTGFSIKKRLVPLDTNYSELTLIWTPEMWPPLYSGHFEKSQNIQIQYSSSPLK